MKYLKLSTPGQEHLMPLVGLGTWRAPPEEAEAAVDAALSAGYRHIDTAFAYNNEEAIGKVLKRWLDSGKVKREELFITTKLPPAGNHATNVEKFLNLSLKNLQLDYVDLYLIHMPYSLKHDEKSLRPAVDKDGSLVLDMTNNNIDTWKVMEEQVRKGLVKSIGISNFNAEQVQEIYDNATVKPAVLQIELHAYLQQKKLRKLCNKLNIAVTAYSSFGSPGAEAYFAARLNYTLKNHPNILGDPLVKQLAEKYNKTPGQILLRHLVQQNIIVIPKSGNPERIKSNIDIFDFELSAEDLKKLNKLDKDEDGRIFDFLFFKGLENHPHYPFKYRL